MDKIVFTEEYIMSLEKLQTPAEVANALNAKLQEYTETYSDPSYKVTLQTDHDPEYIDGYADGYSRGWTECWDYMRDKITEETAKENKPA